MLLSLLFSEPLLFFALVIGIVIALTFHEFAHAYVANMLGDRTAAQYGRLTLNPLAHLDPIGFLMLLVAGFGYAKPVPFNPVYLRDQRMGPVWIGLAGPLSNVFMAVVCSIILRLVEPSLGGVNLLVQFLYLLAFVNINLAIFNCIPIPPLDGSKLLFALLDGPKWRNLRMTLETQGPLFLIVLIILDNVSGAGLLSGLLRVVGNGFFHLMGLGAVL